MTSRYPREVAEILRSASSKKAPTVQSGKSRTADKINVRLPDGIRQKIIESCRAEHITINTFVVQALEERLARAESRAQSLERISEQVAAIATHLGIPAEMKYTEKSNLVAEGDPGGLPPIQADI